MQLNLHLAFLCLSPLYLYRLLPSSLVWFSQGFISHMKDRWISIKSQECSDFTQPEILLSLSSHSDLFFSIRRFLQTWKWNLSIRNKKERRERQKDRRKFSIFSAIQDIVSEIVKLLPFFGFFLKTSWNSLKWSGIELQGERGGTRCRLWVELWKWMS